MKMNVSLPQQSHTNGYSTGLFVLKCNSFVVSKWFMFLMVRKLMNINIETTFSGWSTESKYAIRKDTIYFAIFKV